MPDDKFDRDEPALSHRPFVLLPVGRLSFKGRPALLVPPGDGEPDPDARLSGSDVVREAAIQLLSAARDSIRDNPHLAACQIEEARQLLRGGTRPAGKPRQGGLAPWQVRATREHVQAHLAESLPMRELAQLCRLSVSHFARAFKASLEVTPHGFIMRQRLERAKELMTSTRTSLAEIALACGLSDQSHMTRLFRRLEGCSPAAWRRRNERLEELPDIRRSG